MNNERNKTMHTSILRRTPGRRAAVLVLPALVAAAALGLTACGGSNSASPGSSSGGGGGLYGNSSPSQSKAAAPAVSGTALAVRSTSLVKILTDGRGFTVYAFDADKGTTSACSGACATAWPPVKATGTTPHVGTGVTQSLVGQATRADGTRQLTYNGRPLYLFQGDSAPGSTSGDGSQAFGARWDALTASGEDATGGS
jgi:predicted lipoprotein with Yx(FWY)xxD motif